MIPAKVPGGGTEDKAKDEKTEPERLTGKVLEYQSRRGFGFIVPDGQEDKKIFVHWKQIETTDRWPSLTPGMMVDFSVEEERGRKSAVKVTMTGGDKISLGEDSEKKYNMDVIYKGKVKFYDLKKGFGFIIPVLEEGVEKIEWQGETVNMEKGIYVAREEILTDDEPPALNDGSEVAFRLFHSDKGLGCGHVTAPGGGKIVFEFSGDRNLKRRRGFGGGWGQGNRKRARFGGGGRPIPFRGMGPSSLLSMDTDMIEIGLHIDNKFVGRLIGRGGESVKQIRKDSGANLQFSQSNNPYLQQQAVSVVGDKEQVIKACVIIVQKIKEFSGDEKLDSLVFLIPDAYCGMFIGKGGSILKKIREDSGVKINVSNVPVQLTGGSLVSLAKVTGEVEQIEQACNLIVPKLGSISRRELESQMQAFNLRGSW